MRWCCSRKTIAMVLTICTVWLLHCVFIPTATAHDLCMQTVILVTYMTCIFK